MKIALFGGSGQIGWELLRALAVLGEVRAPVRSAVDLADHDALRTWLRVQDPQLIVNAAAYTAVDAAEGDAAGAFRINAEAPAVMAEEAERLGAWLVHYSSDYVFDGSKPAPYTEDDPARPLSVYGKSKLAGEEAVQAACRRHLVLRASWVYAARGNNFPRTILRLAREREHLDVVDDQFGAPTSAALVADASAHALRIVLAQRTAALAGLYHLCAAGRTNWHGYACHLLELARAHGLPLRMSGTDALAAISASRYGALAPRPHNSCLDTTRFRTRFGLHLPDWREGVARLVAEIAERDRV